MRVYRAGGSSVITFDTAFKNMCSDLGSQGITVDTGHWQSLTDVPQTATVEMTNVSLHYAIPPDQPTLLSQTQAADPWAELQFQERVSGEPRNPGETYHLWPYYRGNVPKHQAEDLKFSHTYMERFWPKAAGYQPNVWVDVASGIWEGREGVRFRYGDFRDVIHLLSKHPHTRQAYLPIFFPEDTGAHHGERIPCTLGYHFMLRQNKLHVMYPIRSCDILRHFRDDVYMAARLAQYIIDELCPRKGPDDERDTAADHPWAKAVPGMLTMHMASLHAFEQERPLLIKRGQR